MWRNLAQFRYVLENFVVRDLKIKYRGSAAGYLWTLLEPLSLVVVYYFVFAVIARRGSPDYPLVVLVAVLPWTYLSGLLIGCTGSLVADAPLIRKVYLPRLLFPLSQVISNLIIFALSLLAVLPFLLYYRVLPGWSLLWLPVATLLLTLFGTGVALVLACLNVLYRDVNYVLRVLLRIGFYACPIVYGLELVPERFRGLYLFNPLSVYILLFRSALLERPLDLPWPQMAWAVAAAVLVFAGGVSFFARWEWKVVKYL